MVTATTSLDNTDEHSTTALYRAAIGDISTPYYLPRFTRFEAADRPGLSWNWAAALNTLNWLMFRQLWHAALVYGASLVILALLMLGIGRVVLQFSTGMQWGLLAALAGLAIAVPGWGGNALYFHATRQRVQRALQNNEAPADACTQLAKQACTRKGLIILATCNLLVAAVAALAYATLSHFETLPTGQPIAMATTPQGRNVASGRAVDASPPRAAVPPLATASTEPASAAIAAIAKQPPPAVAKPTQVAASGAIRTAPPIAPAPLALRSAAAEIAAREVATALRAQSSPVARVTQSPPPSTTTSVSASKRFIVNVGLFADLNNARNALVKLMDAELPVVRKEVRLPKGTRTRVQVGPFETLAEANTAADTVRSLKLEAQVAPLP